MTTAAPNTAAETTVCPLCRTAGVAEVDAFPLGDLQRTYQRLLGVEIDGEFPAGTQVVQLFACRDCGLEFFLPLISGSAAFYERLSHTPAYYSRTRWEFERVRSLIRPEWRVVDVGCGDGHFLSLLGNPDKLGLELNPAAVAKARARGLPVEQSPLQSRPAGSADVITLFQVLEHVPSPRDLIADVMRVLDPGGTFVVTVPNNDGFMGRMVQEPLNLPPHHPLRWHRSALSALPRLFPITLLSLEAEPLSAEHLFAYRRTRVTSAVGAILGRSLSLARLTAGTVLARKLANAAARLSLRLMPRLPRPLPEGHSLLAVYRKTAAGNTRALADRSDVPSPPVSG